MAIVKYARTAKGKITTNLSIEEFHCKCGQCSETVHDEALSFGLQKIRSHFGRPLIINSGYRCPTHNANVGGSPQSYHVNGGRAADIVIPGVNVSEICAYAESIGFYGIGMYDDGYVHLDTRPKEKKAFWRNAEQTPVKTFIKSNELSAEETVKAHSEAMKQIAAILKSLGY